MDQSAYNRPVRLAVMIWCGVVSVYTTVVLPLLVTGVATSYAISSTRAGLIASAEMGGIALGTFLASLVVARTDRRWLIITSAVIAGAANLASVIPLPFAILLPLRIASGLGSGGLLATMAAAVGATRSPDRNFGIFVAGAFVAAALSFRNLSDLANASGVLPLFGILAALNLSVLLVAPYFPRAAPSGPVGSIDGAAPPAVQPVLAIALALAGILAFYLGVGTVWPMMGAIGTSTGLAPTAVGKILAATSLSALAGATSAAFLGLRVGRVVPLIVGLSVTVSSLAWLSVAGAGAFQLAPLLFLFGWNFSVPFLMGTLAALDGTGRAVAFNMTLQYIGFASGPLIAAAAAAATSLSTILWIGLVGCALCLLCFACALYQVRAQVDRSSL